MDLNAGRSFFSKHKPDAVKDDDKQERLSPKGKLDLQAVGLPRLVLIALAGIALLYFSLPTQSGGEKKTAKTESDGALTDEISGEVAGDAMEQYRKRKEKQLEKLLREADGVGNVQVMITLASSEEKVTLQNDSATQESSVGDGAGKSVEKQSASTESVLIRRDGDESPYLVRIISPEVEGVVVVAQGSDGGTVDTEIIAAVQALFSVEAHKIKVMKMK